MKHDYLKSIFTTLLLLCSTAVSAQDFEADGIYYNILSQEYKTVEVTSGTAKYTGSVVIPATVRTSGTATRTFDDWTSTNKNQAGTTSQTSYTMNVEAGYILKFDWSVSSENNYDWLTITLDGTEIIRKSGIASGSYEKTFTTAGTLSLVVKYTKDGSLNKGDDEGKIYNITLGTADGTTREDIFRVIGIKNRAFYECYDLTSIEIPNSVTNIGYCIFGGCNNLTSITIDENNPIYDSRENCNAIIETALNTLIAGCKNTVIPGSVTTIGYQAFYGCSSITNIEIPNSVTTIGNYAFGYCSSLANIEIPKDVRTIEYNAFHGCTSLSSVYISDIYSWCNINFANIYANPLCYAEKLYLNGELQTDIVIPNGVTDIKKYAFYSCKNLTSITIPNFVTTIGSCAFYGCSGLTSITIPEGVTTIGNYAFSDCTSLTSITSLIPADKLFEPGAYAFNYVDKNACTLYVPAGAREAYAATSGWNEFTDIAEIVQSGITITVNQYGSGTFCSPNALDFSNVKGLKAYAATGYKSNSQVVILTRVETAAAGTGLFIKGKPGEYTVPVLESTDEHTLNLLVGTLERTTVNSTDGNMSNFKYTVVDGENTPMFYPFEDNTPYSANRAYLQIPTAWLPTTAQKSVSIYFDEGETTDIEEVEQQATEEEAIYNLQGQKVKNPTRGIYIVNGKRVFIK